MNPAPATTQYENQQSTLETARLTRLLRLAPQFELLPRQCDAKAHAQELVSAGFQRAFSAKLDSFMPQMLTMHCVGKLSGVAGLCFASNQQMFLEQYLDTPIETELHNLSGFNVKRDGIVEVGNLVAANNGASLAVFIVLACSLEQAGFTHMVFTATSSLREKFTRLGFETRFVADAKIQKLKSVNQTDWGSYYEKSPQVVSGELSAANALIAERTLYNCIKSTFASQIDGVTKQLISLKKSL